MQSLQFVGEAGFFVFHRPAQYVAALRLVLTLEGAQHDRQRRTGSHDNVVEVEVVAPVVDIHEARGQQPARKAAQVDSLGAPL